MPSVEDALRLYGYPQQWGSHLSSLQRHFHYVFCTPGNQFEVAFEVPSRQGSTRKVVLTIDLPPSFPYAAPVISCRNERHKFIRAMFVIDSTIHPGLSNWSPTNDLGSLVFDIYMNVFRNDPPQSINPVWTSASGHPLNDLSQCRDPAILNRIIDSSAPLDPQSAPNHSSQLSSPIPSTSSPSQSWPRSNSSSSTASNAANQLNIAQPNFDLELSKVDLGQLVEMCSDETQLNSFFESFDEVQSLKQKPQLIEDSNQQLQTLNMNIQNELDSIHNENRSLKTKLEEQRTIIAQLRARKSEIQARYSKEVIADKLLQAAQNDENRSEYLANLFRQGLEDVETGKPLDLNTFLSKFIDARCSYRIRLDKRDLLLAAGQQQATLPKSATIPQISPLASSSLYSYPTSNYGNSLYNSNNGQQRPPGGNIITTSQPPPFAPISRGP